MNTKLTQLQSYNVMYTFLDQYSRKSNTDDIVSLLSDMSFLQDNQPVDTAVWEDWLDAVNNKEHLTKQEAFAGMLTFLTLYRKLMTSNEIQDLLNILDSNNQNDPVFKMWNRCILQSLQEPEDTLPYLKFENE